MRKDQKVQVVNELRGQLQEAASVVMADFKGLTVEQISILRRKMHDTQTTFRVAKNTLIHRAIDKTKLQIIDELLAGPTALAFNAEDPVISAKILLEFAKDFKNLTIKGAYLDGRLLDEQGVVMLSKLPGKDELRARLLSVLNGVPTKMLRVLVGAQSQFFNVLNARKDALGEA